MWKKSVTADTHPYRHLRSEEDPEVGEKDDSVLELNQDEQPTETGYTTATSITALTGLSPLQPGTTTGDQTFSLPAIGIPRSITLYFHTNNHIFRSLFQDSGASCSTSSKSDLYTVSKLLLLLVLRCSKQIISSMMESLLQQNQK